MTKMEQSFEYVKRMYGVPACVGRIVMVGKQKGVIVCDRGHYVGVNLDCDKPGKTKNAHPTSNIEYFGMGKVRKKRGYSGGTSNILTVNTKRRLGSS